MHPQVDFSFQSSSTSWQAAHPNVWCSRGWFYCMFTAVSSTLYCQRWDQERVRFITQQVWLVNPGVRSESRGVCLIFSFKVLFFHIDKSAVVPLQKASTFKAGIKFKMSWYFSSDVFSWSIWYVFYILLGTAILFMCDYVWHFEIHGIDVKHKKSHLKNKKAKLKIESTLSFELLQG